LYLTTFYLDYTTAEPDPEPGYTGLRISLKIKPCGQRKICHQAMMWRGNPKHTATNVPSRDSEMLRMGIEEPVLIEPGCLEEKHDSYEFSTYKWASPMPVTYI
jgi:hypothetical protein